jgi:phosphoglycolate phosphatase-like HAD superfamily hydrolase
LSNLLIFDLDGVITSEEAYWDAAGLTLHELLCSPRYWNLDNSELDADGLYQPATNAQESRRISRAIFPESEILALKARSINSNWDTCYVAACLHLIDLLALLPDCSSLLPLEPWDDGWIADFRRKIAIVREVEGTAKPHRGRRWHLSVLPTLLRSYPTGQARRKEKRPHPTPHHSRPYAEGDLSAVFDDPIFGGCIGLELINRFDAFASKVLSHTIENVFSRHSPFWAFCRNIFQEWYLGDAIFTETYGHNPAQAGKPGCIHYETPLLPLEQIRATLETLRKQGYVLGFATGRVWQEAAYPLNMYGLFEYFDEQHISTYDDVERAEAALRARGDQTLLSKPNPFPFLEAADRNSDHSDASNRPEGFVVVGDSTSDILGGRAAGAITVAVMTGARTPESRTLLAQSNPDFTIEDMTSLPEMLKRLDGLATIQQMQFTEREKAERLLQRWFARYMNLKTESVTLTPKAVSLNSFNGFYRTDGEEYFFKTHIEEQGIVEEYYHAEQLHQAGYNIVRPLRTIHEEGQQMVIYPVVRWPVMFDLMRAVETGDAEDGTFEMLVSAEKQECARLLDIYRSTFASSTTEEHARAPIHQLFWHRLVGGRFKSFFEGKLVPFLNGKHTQEDSIPFNELLGYRWLINGVPQQKTLGELVERAKVVLDPAQAALTIIGHGDAHFGNVFLEHSGQQNTVRALAGRPQGSPLHFIRVEIEDTRPRYLYFDPAFAGRHSPLLDVIKPLFHNVFATWMYFPHDIAQSLELTVSKQDMTIGIEHNYTLTLIRQAILQTKVEHLLRPLIAELRWRDVLPADWEEIMQLALMCCALLTINLLDGERMPPTVTWLGLLLAVQTGNSGIQPWGYNI